MRYRLRTLLITVSFCAVFIAALVSGSNDWFKVVYSVTFGCCVLATLNAKRSAYCYGFAVVGWAFFIVGFSPWSDPARSNGVVNRSLLTAIIPECLSALCGIIDFQSANASQMDSAMLELRRANRTGIAHFALTLLFAQLAGYLMTIRERRGAQPPERQS